MRGHGAPSILMGVDTPGYRPGRSPIVPTLAGGVLAHSFRMSAAFEDRRAHPDTCLTALPDCTVSRRLSHQAA
jgi:hypothetical protein